jgi:hypothetical protein
VSPPAVKIPIRFITSPPHPKTEEAALAKKSGALKLQIENLRFVIEGGFAAFPYQECREASSNEKSQICNLQFQSTLPSAFPGSGSLVQQEERTGLWAFYLFHRALTGILIRAPTQ